MSAKITLLLLFMLAALRLRAASMSINDLSGPVTPAEINSFLAFMQSQTPPATPWGALDGAGHNDWADGTGGRDLEAMGEMFEVSSNLAILNLMIHWSDDCTSQRNDLMSATNGGQRVMWTGLIDKIWCPNWPTDMTDNQYLYCGCETEDLIGHLAFCAKLILQTPAIWNLTVPDGDPFDYGATYFQRATNYLAKCDEANDEYFLKWFIQSGTDLIRPPTNSAWTSLNENVTAINRQMMFTSGFQRLAEAHEILGDAPGRVAQYDAIVRAATTECLNGMIHYPGNPRTANGRTIYKWGYYPTSTSGAEATEIHAEYDMIGVWRAFNRPAYGFTRAPLIPFANTMDDVIYLGTNTFAVNVDGSGGIQSRIYSGWILPADWNPQDYDVVAGSAYTNGWYKSNADIDAGILFMKNRRYLEFSISPSAVSETVPVGSGTSCALSVAPLGGFTNIVNLAVNGLPSGASAGFSSASVNLGLLDTASTNVTLSILTSPSTPIGNYELSVIGASGGVSHTNNVNLLVGINTVHLTWNGGSTGDNNWSDPANWNGVNILADDTLSFDGVNRLTSDNDTTPDTIYSNLTFNAGAGAFILGGNPITVGANITNNSSNPQTIDFGLNFNSGFTFDGAGNFLILGGGLTNISSASGATTITFAGAGILTNLLHSASNSGGTNAILLNSSDADWTLADNASSSAITVPWVFQINSGAFNFGNSGSAPSLELTTPNNSPSDNQIGAISGATGTFNMVNGTLTTAARFDTATASNSTGIINQTGGMLNIGSQFQGANGSNPGEISEVNVNGGAMNIGGGGGPFYVASRGSGALTVSGSGVVNCGRLDISRNAAGNSFGSAGVVNLNGGTLMVTSVTNVSANQQSGGAPTAIFNFNGGTLMARPGATTGFFQGSAVTPITPITAIVKSGGAIIDDGGNAITIAEPLRHDGALGGAPDGGLVKLGGGTLTLSAANSYDGDTVVSNGILALTGNGSISDSAIIAVAVGATLNAGALTLANGQTLEGGGTINGNVVVGNGAILSPGDSIGTLTFNDDLTLNNGSAGIFEISKSPAGNDVAQVSGNLIYGGTLIITNVGASDLAAGDSFKLFAAANYSGAFTNIIPATPGSGLAWDISGLTNGTIDIVAAQLSVTAVDGNLIFSGAGGSPRGTYYLLASTNLSLPLNQWRIAATNQFDADGDFDFTSAPDFNAPQNYFRLQLQ